MWITLLVMAAAVSLEPFRIGMTVLMLNRPRPLLQLLVFLIGGFAMGTTVGVVVLFILRPALGSAHFTLPRMQLVVGALALVVAAVVATGVLGPKPDRVPGQLVTRAKQLLGGHSLWTASVAGLGIALPSVDYLAALALIVASGAAAATQVSALLLFNVVAFGLVEIPLISYLMAPERTRAILSALQDWLQTHRHRKFAAVLATVGCVLLVAGFAGL
ncbi:MULTISPECIES: GAP family protein [unclassified Mycolicibacterium]|uniref:GAP family protein n=1 Tax=unclassified Mycolicibacterium TaxID=2636767 RepID=UPI0012DC88DE|nr:MULTISPECIES: GAP family protein [unclassified Mycolicibacterium]MUL82604.1 GAP family protein [Mycolicibacterium sp. CBMA 329]MUL88939.1 GAP family protein [Mycolicibacterium sp. CBMA 331]MUL97506.1 GAP family protein [Mycolicibacterium sp. CBMA 334]MUM26768.1 GAP family protein [Mycolicibacterium sp. CBMA 295]MUM38455.1 GAP family protein [Mycolicibacterium sp. CBMA 247]